MANSTLDLGRIIHADTRHTGDAIIICVLITAIALLKPVFAKIRVVPHSVVLLVGGVATGWFLRFLGYAVVLRPDWFFLYMLPSIVLEAGYFLKNRPFFGNIGAIGTYALLGTFLNTIALAFFLDAFNAAYRVQFSFLEICLFCTLICAVDPVAVLCVFESIHVNDLLYICVFGESLLNDAVTIAMYQTLNIIIAAGPNNFDGSLMLLSVLGFIWMSVAGIAIGIVGGFLTALLVRFVAEEQTVLPLLLIFMPYLFYLIAESLHVSAILAIVSCGIVIKNYMKGNLCDQMHFSIEYIYKMASSYSESCIFIFLGFSVSSIDTSNIDYVLIVVTLFGCLVFRFLGVYLLTFFVNMTRCEFERISCVDQFVMAYGGIRGAVCYGLVMSIDENLVPIEHKQHFVVATLAVVFFTTVVQGSSIQSLVNCLKVQRSKHEDDSRTLFYDVNCEVATHVVQFMSKLLQCHTEPLLYRKIIDFDENYLKPKLVAYHISTRGEELLNKHVEYAITNYAANMKKSAGNLSASNKIGSTPCFRTSASTAEMGRAGFNAKKLSAPCGFSKAVPSSDPTSSNAVQPPVASRKEQGPLSRLLSLAKTRERKLSATCGFSKAVPTTAPTSPNISLFAKRKEQEPPCRRLSYSRHLLASPFRTVKENDEDEAQMTVRDAQREAGIRLQMTLLTSILKSESKPRNHTWTQRSPPRCSRPRRRESSESDARTVARELFADKEKKVRRVTSGVKTFLVGEVDEHELH